MIKIVEWTFESKIIDSVILTDTDKNNFLRFYKYMTNEERLELLSII